jgi:hypothetical protein
MKISATGRRGFAAGPDEEGAGFGRAAGRRNAVTLPVSAAGALTREGSSGGVPEPPLSA